MISEMLLTHSCQWCCGGTFSIHVRDSLNDCSVEHNVAGITSRICTTLEKPGNISNRIILVHCLQHFWNSHVA